MKKNIGIILVLCLTLSCSDQTEDILNSANKDIFFPEVTSCSVSDGTVIPSISPSIEIQFSESMDTDSVGSNISLKRGGIVAVSLNKSWTGSSRLILTPAENLAPNNPYILTIGKEAMSAEGFSFISSFKVNLITDDDGSSPEVISSDPVNSATNVPGAQSIIIYFSELMNKNTVGLEGADGTTGAFSLKDKNGQMITGTIGWNGNNLIFKPLNKLTAFDTYTITVTTAAADSFGYHLKNEYSALFTVYGEYIYLRQITAVKSYGMDFNSFYDIYVIDSQNNKIQKFESYGTYILQWTGLSAPRGITVDINGDIYITESGNHRVRKYDPNGTYYGWFGKGNLTTGWHSVSNAETVQMGTTSGEFSSPTGLAADSAGNIYVADTGNNRIQKFNAWGAFISQFGTSGSGNGQLNSPRGLVVDSSGNIYVADSGNNRIQKFNSSFQYLFQFGSSGSANGQFNNPMAITIDNEGNLFITDTGNNRIQKFYPDGTFITAWGSFGSGDNQLNYPTGVKVDSAGYVYVTDYNNNAIKVFRKSE